MMQYEQPMLLVVEFDKQDVVRTSGGGVDSGNSMNPNGSYNNGSWF